MTQRHWLRLIEVKKYSRILAYTSYGELRGLCGAEDKNQGPAVDDPMVIISTRTVCLGTYGFEGLQP